MSSRRRTSSLTVAGLIRLVGLGLFGLRVGRSLLRLGRLGLSRDLLGLGYRYIRLLRGFHPAGPIGLRRHGLFPHQLDHGHRGVVTLTRLDPDDADVSTVAGPVKGPD